jgi:hypothetical protein
MICAKCLQLIFELERLESIHADRLQDLRSKQKSATSPFEYNSLAIAKHDAKLDMVIARLELKRHQRNHPKLGGQSQSVQPFLKDSTPQAYRNTGEIAPIPNLAAA